MEARLLGHYFEEFIVGETISHSLSKTVFESDNNWFSLMTMNYHPVHTNRHFAASAQHGQILVVGTLVIALVVGISVIDISGKAIANLGYDNIEHLHPVFVGDTLYARSKVTAARVSEGHGDRGVVTVETIGYNQDNVDVIKLSRRVLIKRGRYENLD